MALRRDVVRFMREHEDDFAPYMEDGEAFDQYCDRMDKVGLFKTPTEGEPESVSDHEKA